MTILNLKTPVPGLFWEVYDRTVAPSVVAAMEQPLHRGMMPAMKAGAHLLDVGCGGGQQAVRIAAERPDMRVTAIDISPVMVDRATRLVQKAGVSDRVNVQFGDARELAFEDNTFDGVIALGVFKLAPDPRLILRECVRVLKRGGTLLATEVDRGAGHQDIQTLVDRARLPRPLKPVLRAYFSNYVVAQSIGLQDAREMWEPLRLLDSDGPRRIDGEPALMMKGTKP